MQSSPPPPINQIYVCYATETGNSQELALSACQSLPQVHGLLAINQLVFLPGNLYVLFCSTTGQGDMPYVIRMFWRTVMSKNFGILDGVRFCVYGLGDRSYSHNFNLAARKLRQRLLMLHAEQIIPIGLGDQQEPNGVFDNYFSTFYPALSKYLSGVQIVNKHVLGVQDFKKLKLEKKGESEGWRKMKVVKRIGMVTRDGKELFEVKLQIEKEEAVQIGDIIEILPQNSEESIENIKKFLIPSADDPSPESLKTYLSEVANLNNTLNFTFFCKSGQSSLTAGINPSLSPQIQQLFRHKLDQLAIDYDEYYHYVKKYRRNLSEVLQDFSLSMQPAQLVNRLGCIVPRKYSIAGIQGLGNGNQIITLLIKLEKTKISNTRTLKGLCSHDLCTTPTALVRNYKILRHGQFHLPFSPSQTVSICMISLGTGIAPFLPILDQATHNNNNWQLVLFHSCRYRDQMELYLGERRRLLEGRDNVRIFVTCTREQVGENRRVQGLVQDNIGLLQKCTTGKIMICGTKELCEIVTNILDKAGFDAKKLKKEKVLCMENW